LENLRVYKRIILKTTLKEITDVTVETGFNLIERNLQTRC
jgi:hypothetical protein